MTAVTEQELGDFLTEYKRLHEAITFSQKQEVQDLINHLKQGREFAQRPCAAGNEVFYQWIVNFIEPEIKTFEKLIKQIL